jgi:tetratricopeptide (TPR) repeat protein
METSFEPVFIVEGNAPAGISLINFCRVMLFSALALVAGAVCLRAQNNPSSDDTAVEQLRRGGESLGVHNWDGALSEFQEALRIDPNNVNAHIGAGRALGEKGDRDAALAEFDEAIRLNPDSAEAHNGAGWVLGLNGDLDGAVREYREAVRVKPDYFKAHYNIGWALSKKNDLDGSLQEYREATRLQPNDPDAHDGVAWVLSKKGDWDGALREYREVIRLKPSDARPHSDAAWILTQKDDWKGALQEYQKAIRLKPNEIEPHQALGNAYMARKDFDAALREYQEEVRLKPSSAQAHCDVGVALRRKDDWDGALAEHREAVRVQPEFAPAHADLALDLSHQGDWDGGIREAREAIRLQPNHALAHFYLGRGLEHKGDRRAALDEYRQAAKLSPENAVITENFDRLNGDLSILPGNWSPAMVRAFTISAALVPSFLLFGFFRARDLYPEPARALWATFFLGAFIVFPVLLLDWPLNELVSLFHGPIAHGFADALFTAALPEELLKFAVVVLFCSRMKAFNEPMDGIVYGAVASLGFATLENIGYVTQNGIVIAIWRAFSSVPGHAFMGALMGYFVGQWRFGPPAHRVWALIKAYLVPVSLHWAYDFPLLAYGAANKLAGPARQAAMNKIAPFMIFSILILVLETIWGLRVVNRLRREQIQFTRDAVAAAAAAEGAMDIVALMNAPDAPPSAWPGWLMALAGGLVATFGGFISLLVVILFAESQFQPKADFDLFGGTLLGGIPLLIGLVLFAYGVKRIHASTRRLPPKPVLVPASGI